MHVDQIQLLLGHRIYVHGGVQAHGHEEAIRVHREIDDFLQEIPAQVAESALTQYVSLADVAGLPDLPDGPVSVDVGDFEEVHIQILLFAHKLVQGVLVDHHSQAAEL